MYAFKCEGCVRKRCTEGWPHSNWLFGVLFVSQSPCVTVPDKNTTRTVINDSILKETAQFLKLPQIQKIKSRMYCERVIYRNKNVIFMCRLITCRKTRSAIPEISNHRCF